MTIASINLSVLLLQPSPSYVSYIMYNTSCMWATIQINKIYVIRGTRDLIQPLRGWISQNKKNTQRYMKYIKFASHNSASVFWPHEVAVAQTRF